MIGGFWVGALFRYSAVVMMMGMMKMEKNKRGVCELCMNMSVIPTRVVVVQRANLWQPQRPHESRSHDQNKTTVSHPAPCSFACCYLRVQTLMWMDFCSYRQASDLRVIL